MDAANEKFHQNNHKSSHHSSHHPNNHHSHVKSLQKDPELEAEIVYAKENGFEPPRVLPSDTVKKIAETFQDHCSKKLHSIHKKNNWESLFYFSRRQNSVQELEEWES